LKTYPNSRMEEIHERLNDVTLADLRKSLYKMVKQGILTHTPDKTYRKYSLA